MLSLSKTIAISLLFAAAVLTGCASSAISPETRGLAAPTSWQQNAEQAELASPLPPAWLPEFAVPELESLVNEALVKNYALAEQRAVVQELSAAVTSQASERYPFFSVGVDGRRQKTSVDGVGDVYSETYGAGVDLSWELDIWGKLSDQERQAQLSFEAQIAAYTDAQQQLAADVSTNWFAAISAQQQLQLLERWLQNVQQNLDIIKRGYRQGLNEALDVYLAQDTVSQGTAAVANQRQLKQEANSDLQLLLARYPDGNAVSEQENLPSLPDSVPVSTPSELLSRRPDIRQAWLSLLSLDAGLAVAHKQRFPSLNLVGSASSASSALHNLVETGLSGWSIAAGLSQPLFDAGRLEALEEQARAQVLQAEQRYLATVYQAFAEVETLISKEKTLRQRYTALLDSQVSGDAAYDLSFKQYRRGLVTYTTVLESQRRAFDAQTSVVQLRNDLLQNRVDLLRALGGNFLPSVQSQDTRTPI